MQYYSVLPTSWDLKHSKKIKEFNDKGLWTPCDIKEVVEQCGSLYPIIIFQSQAIAYARNLKKKFPYIIFEVFEGKTVGELELIKSF